MTRKLKEFVNQKTNLHAPVDIYGPDHVAILLALHNGARHLSDQLESLARQTHRDWSLIISDDGSDDDWLTIAAEFAAAQTDNRNWLVSGPKNGFAQNFLSLAMVAGPTVPFVAFCDQDDVWLPEKLERALKLLRETPRGVPAVYCGRTMVTDHVLQPMGPSPLFRKPPSFENALVQNIGGGNTMVLNRAALDLVQDTARFSEGVISHDWWVYQLVTGAGGRVFYDEEPCLMYRQHDGNNVGANGSFLARFSRLSLLFAGRFREWNKANVSALERSSHWLTPEARTTLSEFQKLRNGTFLERIAALMKAGIYRQTWQGQTALWIATLTKRL